MAEAAAAPESDRDHLRTYIADLDANGYTVVPPEIATPNGLAARMLEACLDVAERRTGERPDVATGSTDRDSTVGDSMGTMLLEDPVFEESLMNPALLALVTHLCDYNVVLSSMGCSIKGPGDVQFQLHTDTRLPSPLPTQALVCKCIYLLTDFDRDKGSTVFVPGSHKLCRNPVGSETSVGNAVPIDAPAGSLLVFHGNVWHGAHNRVVPGLRVSLHLLMVRPIIRTREDLIDRIPQAVLDRNPARFAILAQQALVPGSIEPGDLKSNIQRTQKYISAFEEETGIELPAKHR